MIWVWCDSSYLAHRARWAIKGLSHDDMPTSVIFGFFEAIRSLTTDHRILSNKFGFFFDSKNSFRKSEFPDYKRHRHETRSPEEVESIRIMHLQVDRLRREILPEIGFRTFKQSGLESDDLMAQASSQVVLQGVDTQAVMVTADSDLYQAVADNVHWLDPSRNLYLDYMGVYKKTCVAPDQWADVLAVKGCRGDGVPGVPGIGIIGAVNHVLGINKAGSKRALSIHSAEGRAIAARNRLLTTLPHRRTKVLDLKEPVYHPEAFFEWCDKLGMDSYLSSGGRRRFWEGFFKGDLSFGDKQAVRKRGVPRAKG